MGRLLTTVAPFAVGDKVIATIYQAMQSHTAPFEITEVVPGMCGVITECHGKSAATYDNVYEVSFEGKQAVWITQPKLCRGE